MVVEVECKLRIRRGARRKSMSERGEPAHERGPTANLAPPRESQVRGGDDHTARSSSHAHAMDPEKLPQQPAASLPARHARTKQALLVVAALLLAAIHGARFWLNSSTTAAQPGGGIWWSQCPDDSTTYCGFLNVPLGALVSPSLCSSSAK